MKILLDECTPHTVKKGLPARNIRTVQEMGWAGVKNGELLKRAEAEFDIFITTDRPILAYRGALTWWLQLVVNVS